MNSSKSRIFYDQTWFCGPIRLYRSIGCQNKQFRKCRWRFLSVYLVPTSSACRMVAFGRLLLCELVKNQDFQAQTAFSGPSSSYK